MAAGSALLSVKTQLIKCGRLWARGASPPPLRRGRKDKHGNPFFKIRFEAVNVPPNCVSCRGRCVPERPLSQMSNQQG